MIKIEKLNPFGRMCVSLGMLPSSYKESLTYEEQLLWFMNYLENVVIPAINNNADAVEELQNLYIQIKTYVDEYFENLDVQEEINNKLDDMADSGELTEIIAQYLNLAGLLVYDTVSDLKVADNLIEGSICKTLGYNNIDDGGGCLYKVRTVTNEDVIDEGKLIALSDNTLVAEMIENHFINPIMFGCSGDNITDDSTNFLKCLVAYNDVVIDLLNKKYNLESLNSFTFNKNTTLKNGVINIDNIIMRNEEGLLTLENVEINSKSLTDKGSNQQYLIFSESGDVCSLNIKNSKIVSEKTNDYNNIVALICLKGYKNVNIENCVLHNLNQNETAGGCIWLSNKEESGVNVIINNNEIYNTSKDESLAIYDLYESEYNLITNNKIKQIYASTYSNNLYNKGAKIVKIENNIFESCTTEFAFHDMTSSNPIYFNNNIMIHDSENQTENSKSGVYVDGNYNINLDKNIFKAINCNNATYTIVSHQASNCIINNWNVEFDYNSTYNSIGQCVKVINSIFKEVYAIIRNLENCEITTTTGRLNSNLTAINCIFNMTNGVEGGYAANTVIFKNCVGGKFSNNAKVNSLIIENSSVDYGYGSLSNLVNNQTRLTAACNNGHIYYSSMDGTAIDNLTQTSA